MALYQQLKNSVPIGEILDDNVLVRVANNISVDTV